MKSQFIKPYPMKSMTNLGEKLPRLGAPKKRAFHSKDPFKIKKIMVPDDSKIPKKKLNGYLFLELTKNELPTDIAVSNLSSKKNLFIERAKYN